MEGAAPAEWSAVLGCVVGWLGWSVLVGSLANRLPPGWLERPGRLTGPRPWGESQAGYEQGLRIRRWKSRVPDAGDALPGGIRKSRLVGRDAATLHRLVAETHRAELVHLAIWPFWIVTALWLPPGGVVINLLFSTAFNLPCLWVQRYNRLRLLLLLSRLEAGARS